MKSQAKNKNNKTKVFVGVSGGVDSSVALALLQKQGFDVTGVFLKVWHPDFLPCDWKEERRSAMRVCATLGVPFLTMDCEAEYKKEVVDYMIAEYRAGRTPNPDVFCNKYVKFGTFLQKALFLGADFVATGHYAQIEKSPQTNLVDSSLEKGVSEPGRREAAKISAEILRGPFERLEEKEICDFELHEAADSNKDQSYFLYTLNQKQLSRTLFPVGRLRKPEVRKLAERFSLSTAAKKDSQGVCFLENIDIKDFLSRFIETKKGDVLNVSGEVIGWHDGAVLYTIGERRGFIITKKSPKDPPLFVVAKDLQKNTITVADKKTESDVVYSTKEILVKDLHFIGEQKENFKCEVRIRYRQEKQECTVTKKSDGWHIAFAEPQNGVALGQSAVLYDNSLCLGGGIIEKVF